MGDEGEWDTALACQAIWEFSGGMDGPFSDAGVPLTHTPVSDPNKPLIHQAGSE